MPAPISGTVQDQAAEGGLQDYRGGRAGRSQQLGSLAKCLCQVQVTHVHSPSTWSRTFSNMIYPNTSHDYYPILQFSRTASYPISCSILL
jgi:hypothetical protein